MARSLLTTYALAAVLVVLGSACKQKGLQSRASAFRLGDGDTDLMVSLGVSYRIAENVEEIAIELRRCRRGLPTKACLAQEVPEVFSLDKLRLDLANLLGATGELLEGKDARDPWEVSEAINFLVSLARGDEVYRDVWGSPRSMTFLGPLTPKILKVLGLDRGETPSVELKDVVVKFNNNPCKVTSRTVARREMMSIVCAVPSKTPGESRTCTGYWHEGSPVILNESISGETPVGVEPGARPGSFELMSQTFASAGTLFSVTTHDVMHYQSPEEDKAKAILRSEVANHAQAMIAKHCGALAAAPLRRHTRVDELVAVAGIKHRCIRSMSSDSEGIYDIRLECPATPPHLRAPNEVAHAATVPPPERCGVRWLPSNHSRNRRTGENVAIGASRVPVTPGDAHGFPVGRWRYVDSRLAKPAVQNSMDLNDEEATIETFQTAADAIITSETSCASLMTSPEVFRCARRDYPTGGLRTILHANANAILHEGEQAKIAGTMSKAINLVRHERGQVSSEREIQEIDETWAEYTNRWLFPKSWMREEGAFTFDVSYVEKFSRDAPAPQPASYADCRSTECALESITFVGKGEVNVAGDRSMPAARQRGGSVDKSGKVRSEISKIHLLRTQQRPPDLLQTYRLFFVYGGSDTNQVEEGVECVIADGARAVIESSEEISIRKAAR